MNKKTIVNPDIRVLSPNDIDEFWPLRLRAVKEEPESFGMSYEESAETPIKQIAARLETSDAAFVLGAFAPNLVGMVGYFRQTGLKVRHKGTIWGMYVLPEARGKGLGRALMQVAISRARAIPELEQLILKVVTTNKAAHELYLSLGFVSFGIEREGLKLGDKYLDEDMMYLRLHVNNGT